MFSRAYNFNHRHLALETTRSRGRTSGKQFHGLRAGHRPLGSDYGAGLAKIIGNLTARYSLGFTLGEQEKDDGRMHQLSIRVKALDAKGKTRKLDVSTRRGYFMPKDASDVAVANQVAP